jgi:hypothetical protein
MKLHRVVGPIIALLAAASILPGQAQKEEKDAAAPPKIVLLMHREFQPGRGSERQKLQVATAQACDRLETPSYWLDLESLTGPREEVFFDLFDSFEELEQVDTGWRQFYATHRDLAHLQEEIEASVESERTIVAVRREDLGYKAENVDLSEMRYLRVQEVRIIPGHESDFEEAYRLLAEEFAKNKSDTPWLVYQANVGMSTPAFLIFMPMTSLAKNDDLLAAEERLLEAENGETERRLQEIARESYVSVESNLYEVRPEMSHVSKEWAAGNSEFWRPRREQAPKAEVKPTVRR